LPIFAQKFTACFRYPTSPYNSVNAYFLTK
jgi:hypothetical protein